MERRNNYNDLKPFRFWCQKILPLVYDDSLSYYELLDKVIDYLNKTMEDVTVLNDDTEAMYAAYNQLQSYVNNYFDNLDVQDEINAKLDQMAIDGTLSSLINPQIPGAVSAWLAANVNPVGSAVIVDATLSIAGAAADAKVTGDRINDLNDSLTRAEENIYENDSLFRGINLNETDVAWTVGYITVSTGIPNPGAINVSSYTFYSELISSDEPINFRAFDGHSTRYFRYNKTSGEYDTAIGNQTPPYNAVLSPEYAYRIQYTVRYGATLEEANQAIENISTHINLKIPKYAAPINRENLESIGVEFDDSHIDWSVGYISPSTGEFKPNISIDTYHICSDKIITEYGFSISTPRRMRWFFYDKITGDYVTGVNWQPAPVQHDFTTDYAVRLEMYGEPTEAGAELLIRNIDDYISIDLVKEYNVGWITYLPITDVYIGDVQQRIYFNELARYNESEGYFTVSVNGATYPVVTYTDRYIEFNAAANAVLTLTVTITYYYKDTPTPPKILTVHVNTGSFGNRKVMFIGDSYTQNGGMIKWFKDHNAGVTLYGTRSTTIDNVEYKHEGRGGWTSTNYISSASKSGVSNPFYNPDTQTFDFTYYMNNAGSAFTDVEIVNILLGRNSGFPISNMDNLDIMVTSIKNYNPSIRVILMCDNNLAFDNSGAGKWLQNVHTANRQSHVYNAAFYERYKNSNDVIMCFANLNLDNIYDYETDQVDSSITNDTKVTMYVDNVHPWNIPGLGKFGIALNGLLRNILN